MGLCITRKLDEEIMIGPIQTDRGERTIVIKIIEIGGGQVRLNCDAMDNVPIHRAEVYRALARKGPVVSGPIHSAEFAASQRAAAGGQEAGQEAGQGRQP